MQSQQAATVAWSRGVADECRLLRLDIFFQEGAA